MQRNRFLQYGFHSSYIIALMSIGFFANGYFEHKYYCLIEGHSIQVSIQTGERLCFEFLESMETKIVSLQEDITRARGYSNLGSEDDQAYRNRTVAELIDQKQDWISLRERLIVAIDDYERDLFLRVKGLTTYYLKPERETVFEKVNQSIILLMRLKEIGDVSRYEFVLEKLTDLQTKGVLLDRIKFSQSFSELIPALKEYLRLPRINNGKTIS